MNARSIRIQRHVANLGASDDGISRRAEACLIRYYGNDAIPYLIRACESDNSVVRYRAVWVLGHPRAAEVFDTIRRLCDDPDERVHYDAIMALGVLDDDRAIPYLIELMLLCAPTRPGASALHRMGPKCVPYLLPYTHHQDEEVRKMVNSHLEDWTDCKLES